MIDRLGNPTTLNYDPAGRIKTITAPNGANTTYTYDDLGNLTKESSADRGTTTYSHDDAGNVIEKTDARGITLNYQYDARNRLIQIDAPGTNEDITYTWDDCTYGIDRLCEIQENGHTIRFNYTPFGEVASESHGSHTIRYQYANSGHLSTLTYPSGRTVTYQRDTVARITKMDTQLETIETGTQPLNVLQQCQLPHRWALGIKKRWQRHASHKKL